MATIQTGRTRLHRGLLATVLTFFFTLAGSILAANAGETQAWRTPDGELYFGSAPPAGSTRIESMRPTRPSEARTTMPRSEPTAARPLPTRVPSAVPTVKARPTAPATMAPRAEVRPIALPTPTPIRHPHAEPVASGEPECGDVVAIRDSRPTIDFEADQLTIAGEVLITTRAVEHLEVCLAESCTLVARGKVLAEGDAERFFLRAARGRPSRLRVRCRVLEGG